MTEWHEWSEWIHDDRPTLRSARAPETPAPNAERVPHCDDFVAELAIMHMPLDEAIKLKVAHDDVRALLKGSK